MSLPTIIEWIRSRRRPNTPDQYLVGEGAQQNISAIFAANTSASISVANPSGGYAGIGYKIKANKDMVVPGAFSVNVYQSQQTVVTGIIDEGIIDDGIDAFLIVTQAQPVVFELTNRTPVNQVWANDLYYLFVANREDMILVYDMLSDYENTGGVRALLRQIEADLNRPTLPVEARPPQNQGGSAQPGYPVATWPPR